MALGLFLSVAIPLIFLYIIWAIDLYATAQLRLVSLGVGWGVVSFGVAYGIQATMLDAGFLTETQLRLLSAPVLEELLKAFFLVGLAEQMRLRYAVDGAAYGFAVGTGFAISENIATILNHPELGISIAVVRVLSTSLMHAYTGALMGAILGRNVYMVPRARLVGLGMGLASSIILHATYNALVMMIAGRALIVVAITVGLSGTLLLSLLIRRSLYIEAQAISVALTRQLTAGELSALRRPEQLADILVQYMPTLGKSRINAIRQFIALQAEYGLLNKTLHQNQRPRMQSLLQDQLRQVEDHLGNSRQQMGLYTWVWLRTVLPSEESPLWQQLSSDVAQEQPLLQLILMLTAKQQALSPQEIQKRHTLLAQSQVFSTLNREDLYDVAVMLNKERYEIGQAVIIAQTINTRLFCVASGQLLESAVDEQGTETIMVVYSPADVCGYVSMLDEAPTTTQVTCVSDAEVYSLSRADFLTIAYGKPQVALALLQNMAGELRRQTDLLKWVRQTSQPNET